MYHSLNNRSLDIPETWRRGAPQLSGNANSPERRQILCERARQIRYFRDLRTESFNQSIFGEPAWDILLALYTIADTRRRLNTRELCLLAGVALTTTLRWLDFLEAEGMICRAANPFDQRMVHIEMADKGRAAMDTYLSKCWNRL